MENPVRQRWIRLFNLIERTLLEQSLNLFLKEFPDAEIKVWNDSNGWWNASVIYSYPESPTYIEEKQMERLYAQPSES